MMKNDNNFCGERHATESYICQRSSSSILIPPKDAASVVQGDIIDLAYSKSSPDIVRVAWTYPSSFVNDFSKPARMKRKQEKIKKSMYKRWKERQF